MSSVQLCYRGTVISLVICFIAADLNAQPKAANDQFRLALVSTEKDPAIDSILVLAEAQLSEDGSADLLDRRTINKILAEQKLSLSGFVQHDQILKAGKLLRVDLFAVLETDVQRKQALGLVVFNAVTGVRLWDAPLADTALDKAADGVTEGVLAAVKKYRNLGKKLKTVCVAAIRNVDLPRAKDSLCDAIGFLLERGLVTSPSLAMLERTRLAQVLEERNLPVDSPLRHLLASTIRIELSIQRAGKGIRATAHLFDSSGKALGKQSIESPNEDPVRAAQMLLPELTKMLKASPAKSRPDRKKEALRFAREADHFYFHHDRKRELPAREAAVALNPEDFEQRRKLALAVYANGMTILQPYFAGPKYVSSKDLGHALSIILRALEQHDVVEAVWRKEPSRVDVVLPSIDLSLLMKMEKRLFVKAQTSETEKLWKQLTEVNARMVKARFDHAVSQVADKTSFEKLTGMLYATGPVEIASSHGLTSVQLRAHRQEYLSRWLDLAERYGNPPFSRREATMHFHVLRVAVTEEIASSQVERYRRKLRASGDPLVRLYDKLLDLQAEIDAKKSSPAPHNRKFREFRLFVQEMLTSAEGKRSIELRAACYDTFGVLLWHSPERRRMTYQHPLVQEFYKLGQFMIAQNDVHPKTIYDLVTRYPRRGSREEESKAIKLITALQRVLDSPKSRIVIHSGETRKIRRESLQQTLAKRREQILSRFPDLGAVVVNPWTDVRELIDIWNARSGIVRLAKPLVRDDAIYVVALGQEKPVPRSPQYLQLLRFSLPEGKQTALGKIAVETGYVPPTDKQRAFLFGFPNFGERNPFVVDACLYDDNYILGTRDKGIFIFSLDGKMVQHLHASNGLPSNHIQSLACLDNQLFVALGELRKEAYLVVHDLRTGDHSVVASSRRADVRSPFDDERPWMIYFMVSDPARHQVLFAMEIPSKLSARGLWSIDTKTHKLRHLQLSPLGYPNANPSWISTPRKGKVLFAGFATTYLVDLQSGVSKSKPFHPNKGRPPNIEIRLAGIVELAEAREPIQQLLDGHFLYDGWLWSASNFTRLSLDGRIRESLPSPRKKSKLPFHPHEGFQLIGNRMLLADAHGIWLATLRKARK